MNAPLDYEIAHCACEDCTRANDGTVVHKLVRAALCLASASVVVAILMLFVWCVLRSEPAEAHSFYATICCSGDADTGDCQPVPDAAITPIDGGVAITLRPGDHRLVTKPHSYQIEQSKIRQSPDGRWHVCLYPTEDKLQCVYGPPYGS